MKLPKQTKKYCKTCKTSTLHKIDQYKVTGKRSSLSHGSKQRIQKRGKCKGHGNLGRLSKGPISGFKRVGAKISKKTALRYTCIVCKKAILQKAGIRAKKVEFQ